MLCYQTITRSMYNSFIIILKAQFIIFLRYLNVLMLLASIFIVTSIFFSVINEHLLNFNLPLIITIGGSLIGPLLCDSFIRGREENLCYSLAPWSVRTILITKSLVWIFFMVSFPIVFLTGSSIIFDSEIEEYLQAFIFMISSISVFIVLGTRISIMPRTFDNSKVNLLMFLSMPIAAMPYIIFSMWLKSILACLLFSIILILFWYIYLLPINVNNYHRQNYNL